MIWFLKITQIYDTFTFSITEVSECFIIFNTLLFPTPLWGGEVIFLLLQLGSRCTEKLQARSTKRFRFLAATVGVQIQNLNLQNLCSALPKFSRCLHFCQWVCKQPSKTWYYWAVWCICLAGFTNWVFSLLSHLQCLIWQVRSEHA